MNSLQDYYKTQCDEYYEKYRKQSDTLSYLTGTILGILKYGDVSKNTKKQLIDGLIRSYKYSGLNVSESTQKDLDLILQKENLAY
jgi:polyhydroxyalkanoate synthesis regulator phasin